MRNLLIFSILSVFSFNAFSAESMFIPHKEFVNLDQKQKEFYVKAIRQSVVAVMSTEKSSRGNQGSFLKESWLLEIIFPKAIAEESPDESPRDNLRRRGLDPITPLGRIERYGIRRDCVGPAGTPTTEKPFCKDLEAAEKKGPPAPDTSAHCTFKGWVPNDESGRLLFQEICNGKPGVRSKNDVTVTCDLDRVGVENRYPCLPIQVYGYQDSGNLFCVSAGERSTGAFLKHLEQCRKAADQVSSSATKAAAVITLNPENYEKLGQNLNNRCRFKDTPLHEKQGCDRAIALLEDARVYVGVKKSNDSSPSRNNGNVH